MLIESLVQTTSWWQTHGADYFAERYGFSDKEEKKEEQKQTAQFFAEPPEKLVAFGGTETVVYDPRMPMESKNHDIVKVPDHGATEGTGEAGPSHDVMVESATAAPQEDLDIGLCHNLTNIILLLVVCRSSAKRCSSRQIGPRKYIMQLQAYCQKARREEAAVMAQ